MTALCWECALPLDDDFDEDGDEALTVQMGVICRACAGTASPPVPTTGGPADAYAADDPKRLMFGDW